jgi:23S rRNA pseudouridine2605 synthase
MRNNFGKNSKSRAGTRRQEKPVARGRTKPAVKKTGEKESGISAGKPKSRIYKSKTHTEKKGTKKQIYTDEVRLNRFIANAGICSRREADKFIAAGLVSVNGTITTEMGVKVKPGDDVRFDGRRLTAEKKVYILLNKPKDYVTTTDDPHAERTVMELVKDSCNERIYPVGRLDRNTTGVLLFTNDGDLSKKLTHPSHKMKKVYQVTLDKALSKNHMVQLADGVELEDGPIAADAISYISSENKAEIGLEIHSGRNRIVRRIFEHLGYHVKKLDRVYFAGLTKKNLPRGKWRELSGKEIQFLKMQ